MTDTGPTVEKLRRWSAEKLMGWTLRKINIPCSVVTDEEYYEREDGSFAYWKKEWHPTQNITQALGDGGPDTVVGALETKGWTIWALRKALDGSGRYYCAFINKYSIPKAGFGNTPATAISEAAKAALEGEELLL